jgi:hypothetical protein
VSPSGKRATVDLGGDVPRSGPHGDALDAEEVVGHRRRHRARGDAAGVGQVGRRVRAQAPVDEEQRRRRERQLPLEADAVGPHPRHRDRLVEVGGGDGHRQQAGFVHARHLGGEVAADAGLTGVEGEDLEVLVAEADEGVAGAEAVVGPTEDGRGADPALHPGDAAVEIGGADDEVIDPHAAQGRERRCPSEPLIAGRPPSGSSATARARATSLATWPRPRACR